MLALSRSPEGAVCCIMARWMLPTSPPPSRGAAGAPQTRRAPGSIPPRAGARRVPSARQWPQEVRPPAESIAVPPRSPATRPGVPPAPRRLTAHPAPDPPVGSARRCRPLRDLGLIPSPGQRSGGTGRAPALAAGMLKEGRGWWRRRTFFFPPFWLLWKVV